MSLLDGLTGLLVDLGALSRTRELLCLTSHTAVAVLALAALAALAAMATLGILYGHGCIGEAGPGVTGLAAVDAGLAPATVVACLALLLLLLGLLLLLLL